MIRPAYIVRMNSNLLRLRFDRGHLHEPLNPLVTIHGSRIFTHYLVSIFRLCSMGLGHCDHASGLRGHVDVSPFVPGSTESAKLSRWRWIMDHYDAIVIGTGFGGTVAATRLAAKHKKVLLLERGTWWFTPE